MNQQTILIEQNLGMKTEIKAEPTELFDPCLSDISNINIKDLYMASEFLLSDSIWDKFELDPSLGDDSLFEDLISSSEDFLEITSSASTSDDKGKLTEIKKEIGEIRYHDCMWAGRCGNSEHCSNYEVMLPKFTPLPCPPVAPGYDAAPAAPQLPVAAGRSLLLKTVMKPPIVHVSPDSPPISDDEDLKGQTSTLRMLNDAINECDLDEDSDLCDYFGEDGDFVPDPEEDAPPPPPPKPYYTAESDHSYHKDKNASMRIASLGIETPSDSEEEIDVVSVGEKSRVGHVLPTNPTSQYQQDLERKVKTAISNRRKLKPYIKTRPPIRKCEEQPPNKKPRGIKRTSKHRYGMRSPASQQPYKRQANGSDSEPDIEKRSLHNNMERQRRIDLRNAFEDLRMLVPSLNALDRAAKVQILQYSRDYCYHLTDVSQNMQRKVQEMRRQQERLRARVSNLRRSLAAKR